MCDLLRGRILCMACRRALLSVEPQPCTECGRMRKLAKGLCRGCALQRVGSARHRACRDCLEPTAWTYCRRCYERRYSENLPVRRCRECRRRKRIVRNHRCAYCYTRTRYRKEIRTRFSALVSAELRHGSPLARLLDHLLVRRGASTAVQWLKTLSPAIAGYLRSVARGKPLSLELLATLAGAKGQAHLVRFCQDAELVPRDAPRITAVERIVDNLAEEAPTWVGLTLRQFWRFSLKPAIVARSYRYPRLDPDLRGDRRLVYSIHRFLLVLHNRGKRLCDIEQTFLDAWIPTCRPSLVAQIKRFLLKALPNSRLRFPRPHESRGAATPFEIYRSAVARSHVDAALALPVRSALIFVALFERNVSQVVRLRPADVLPRPGGALLAFRQGPALQASLSTARVLLAHSTSARSWLFPSPLEPTRPMSAATLRKWLRECFRLSLRELKNAALRDLFSEHDPELVGRMFGFSLAFATRWNKRLGANSRGYRHSLDALQDEI